MFFQLGHGLGVTKGHHAQTQAPQAPGHSQTYRSLHQQHQLMKLNPEQCVALPTVA